MVTYLVGVAVLAVMVLPPAWAAVEVQRRLLPRWSGPPAWLVAALVWGAQMTAVPALLGGVGLFERVPVMIGLVVVAVALARLTPRSAPGADSTADSSVVPASSPASRTDTLVAGGITALLAGPWIVTMWQSWRFGTTGYDTLDYHLPFAVRWFQTGSTWHVQQLTPGLIVPYHPASAELLNGLGMLAFHSDLVSPALNVLWLALLGLAAWCVGRPVGRAPHCLALAMIVANAPFMVSSQAGSGMTDLAVVALTVAVLALVVQGVRIRSVAIPVGVAVGLAVGVKLDALSVAGVVLVGMIVLAAGAARDRIVVGLSVLVPAVVIGGFWYARDFAAVGNPLPGLDVGVFPKVKAPIDQIGGYSVLHYVSNVTVIHRYFILGLRVDFGTLWPLWLAVGAAGAIGVAVWGPSSAYRLAGITALVALFAYVITPTSAFGALNKPTLFVYNVRYAMVGLVAGAALLPAVTRLASEVAGRVLLGIAGVLGLGMLLWHLTWPIPPDLSVSWRTIGWIVSAITVVLVLGLMAAPRAGVATLAAVTVVLGLVGGAFIQTRWIRKQYTHVARLSPALAWGRTVHHARIAFTGLGLGYPLAGSDDSNHTQYIGVSAAQHEYQEVPDCRTLRVLLAQGKYQYVVFSPDYSTGHLPTRDAWVRGADGAVPVLSTPVATVYRLTRPLDPTGCPT